MCNYINYLTFASLHLSQITAYNVVCTEPRVTKTEYKARNTEQNIERSISS